MERFHRILFEEWAHIRGWVSETQRANAYSGFIHFYNHHRPHGSLKWATPISILKDNLRTEHTERISPATPNVMAHPVPSRIGRALGRPR